MNVILTKGGWVSERGRLRDDPYIIIEASPVVNSAPRSAGLQAATSQHSRVPASDGDRLEAKSRQDAVDALAWMSPHTGQKQHPPPKNSSVRKHVSRAGGSLYGRTASQDGGRDGGGLAPPRKSSVYVRDWDRHQPRPGKRKGSLATETIRKGSHPDDVRPNMGAPAARHNEYESASGGKAFGSTNNSCTRSLETDDTGDKVKCPVCHCGMDHWKSGQRQQVRKEQMTSCISMLPSFATCVKRAT